MQTSTLSDSSGGTSTINIPSNGYILDQPSREELIALEEQIVDSITVFNDQQCEQIVMGLEEEKNDGAISVPLNTSSSSIIINGGSSNSCNESTVHQNNSDKRRTTVQPRTDKSRGRMHSKNYREREKERTQAFKDRIATLTKENNIQQGRIQMLLEMNDRLMKEKIEMADTIQKMKEEYLQIQGHLCTVLQNSQQL